MQNFRLLTAHMKFHQICSLIVSFCWKNIKFQQKKYRGFISLNLKIDAKFVEKLICCFKYNKNLENFDLNTQNSQIFYFDWFVLCKVYAWNKNEQRSYVSWLWRVMQNLKKNWLVIWKMTWKNWQIFTRVLESLKIGTLMRFFYPK